MSYKEKVIELKKIYKIYKIYKKPIDRLLQMLPWNKNKKLHEEFYALKNINLDVFKGDVIGIIGQNGAGKSTLLQIICQTLQPSSGIVNVRGRIAALLELGSGFNPEFSGRENVYMAGAIAGLSKEEIDRKFDSIVEFAGIRDYIDNVVKTYSSGMMVRLAFSVATSIEPDILVIDEALSVGDGAFARKSFDRIMSLKDKGCTILFCSHSLYQVEVLCNKVMWLDHGEIKAFGEPGSIINEYQKYLDMIVSGDENQAQKLLEQNSVPINKGSTHIKNVYIYSDDGQSGDLEITCCENDINIEVTFSADKNLPMPTLGIVITDDKLRNITSCGSFYDKISLKVDNNGIGKVKVVYPKIALLKGVYYIHIFLLCEKAIYVYDGLQHCSKINVKQKGKEVGVVSLPRKWEILN